jgi:hypothetical protein
VDALSQNYIHPNDGDIDIKVKPSSCTKSPIHFSFEIITLNMASADNHEGRCTYADYLNWSDD